MKLKRIILLAAVSVFMGTEALAGTDLYGWQATDNGTLFGMFRNYMNTLQNELVGEPLYYQAQELLIECEANYKTKPYAWLSQVHRFCDMAESVYGPAASHPYDLAKDKYARIRKSIQMLRDFPMHEVSIEDEVIASQAQKDAFFAANSQWLNNKRKQMLEWLASPAPAAGFLQICKVYSSGVILRTAGGCIGIDICYADAFGTTEGQDRLAEALDVLYVTHAHGDHYDVSLIGKMLSRGKAVVMTKDITRLGTGKEVIWTSDHTNAVKLGKNANTSAIMAAQGDEPCLLFHIEMDGWVIIAVGDNSHHDKEIPLSKMKTADVVIAPIFQGITKLFENISGAPGSNSVQQFYLNIHENEFHHQVDRRVSFKYMYNNTAALANKSFKYPCTLLLGNGENITLSK